MELLHLKKVPEDLFLENKSESEFYFQSPLLIVLTELQKSGFWWWLPFDLLTFIVTVLPPSLFWKSHLEALVLHICKILWLSTPPASYCKSPSLVTLKNADRNKLKITVNSNRILQTWGAIKVCKIFLFFPLNLVPNAVFYKKAIIWRHFLKFYLKFTLKG